MLRLRKLREARNLSQTKVASDLNITRQLYGYYENGKRQPSTITLQKIADYFRVSLDYLVGRDTNDLDKLADKNLPPLAKKDKMDIAKHLDNLANDLDTGITFYSNNKELNTVTRNVLYKLLKLSSEIAKYGISNNT